MKADDLLVSLDWISPAAGFLGDIMHGGGVTLAVPAGSGWSGLEVERLLRAHGIGTWGLMLVGGDILVTVSRRQAEWAEYVLWESGVPVGGGER